MKIVTVTVNPAIDFTLYLETLHVGEINAVYSSRKDSGGKGINVSKVLRNLGVDTIATGFLGGSAGDWIQSDLAERLIAHDFLGISGETRTNVKVITAEVETQLNGAGPDLSNTDADRLAAKLNEILAEGDGLILAGSLPKQTEPTFYNHLIRSLAKDVFIAVDTSGDALAETLKARPHFIKPNEEELSELVGINLDSEDEIIQAATVLVAKGIQCVLVSMGEKGSILVSAQGVWKAIPPKIVPNSTIGAGDSTVAGFAAKFLETRNVEASLVFANACGVATALKPGSQVCTKNEVEEIIQQIKCNQMKVGEIHENYRIVTEK